MPRLAMQTVQNRLATGEPSKEIVVGPVVPASLRAAETLLPCPCKMSICRSFVTICSAPNRPFGMALLLARLILSLRLVQKRQVRSLKSPLVKSTGAPCQKEPVSRGRFILSVEREHQQYRPFPNALRFCHHASGKYRRT